MNQRIIIKKIHYIYRGKTCGYNIMECLCCHKKFHLVLRRFNSAKYRGKFCSHRCQGLYHSSNKHWNWKGNKIKYFGVHDWIYKIQGKPKICIDCGITYKKRKLAWSNINHKYQRNLNDYQTKCYSCHRKYDLKNNLKPNNKIGSNQFKKHSFFFKK